MTGVLSNIDLTAVPAAGRGEAERVRANRLLVVDDSQHVCQFIARVAQPLGYAVVPAHTLEEFRSAYASISPTLCVIDLNLGHDDGVDVLNALSDMRSKTPVILMSGCELRVLQAVGRLARERGLDVVGEMEKPIVLDTLRDLLSKRREHEWEDPVADLQRAIEAGEIQPFYQPKVDLATGRVVGVEALARWLHPQRGLIPPGDFIPLAESHDLIGRLTAVILAASLRDNRQWSQNGRKLTVAVNVSAKLLSLRNFIEDVLGQIRKSEVESNQLILEVTESTAMSDVTLALEVFTKLRLRGVGLAIDDFGTGYSNLLWLQRMPFSEMKIDRAFTAEILSSEPMQIIIRAIIDLGHNLGLKVVAEGVSDAAIRDRCRQMGVDIAQGFYYARPLSNTDFLAWLDKYENGEIGN
jgi:EAL domain-containing protein (putative c-di-GMP-specific phosphodiesterase class I)